MDRTTYRRLMIGLGAALALVVAFIWIVNPLGDEAALPTPLQDVFPPPGDTVVRQTVIEVDLPVGYEIELEVDGVRIPDSEVTLLEGTGIWTWGPGPGRLWEVWEGGDHTVTVRWDTTSGLPDPGQFTWSFRVV